MTVWILKTNLSFSCIQEFLSGLFLFRIGVRGHQNLLKQVRLILFASQRQTFFLNTRQIRHNLRNTALSLT